MGIQHEILFHVLEHKYKQNQGKNSLLYNVFSNYILWHLAAAMSWNSDCLFIIWHSITYDVLLYFGFTQTSKWKGLPWPSLQSKIFNGIAA